MLSRHERDVIVGIFHDRPQAQKAINDLERAGFSEEQTGFAIRGMKDPGDDDSLVENDAELEEEATGGGVLTGGAVGGVLGAAATGLIPGVGPVIAAGALAGILGGAAAGGVAGGVLGTLKGIGVPDDEAKIYEEEFQAGRPIVTVRHEGRADEACDILERNGAYDAHSRPVS